jgi:uncharacterized membrane-anchored protein YhcB (DUF1043 family)
MDFDLIVLIYGILLVILAIVVIGVLAFEIGTGRYKRFRKLEEEFDAFEEVVRKRREVIQGHKDKE